MEGGFHLIFSHLNSTNCDCKFGNKGGEFCFVDRDALLLLLYLGIFIQLMNANNRANKTIVI